MSRATATLLHDHQSLDTVLQELRSALSQAEVQESYRRLDLFWARLAMHIRAEHLHLFPTILRAVTDDGQPSLSEATAAIDELRRDHEFFMRELAAAISTMRELPLTNDQNVAIEQLQSVTDRVVEVELRLKSHNQAEENHVYLWAENLLGEKGKADLASRMKAELSNVPSRLRRSSTN